MNSRYLLSIDAGTTSLKLALIDHDERVVQECHYPYAQDEWLWFDQSFLQPFVPWLSSVVGVAICGQAPTVVPLLHDGSVGHIHYYHQSVQPLRSCESVFLPHIQAHKCAYPDEYTQVKYYLPLTDYIAYLFTGQCFASLPHEKYRSAVWDDKQIRLYGIDAKLLPPIIVWPAYYAYSQLGLLPANIPVWATTYDFLAALVAIDPNEHTIGDRGGNSLGLNFTIADAQLLSQYTLPMAHLPWRVFPHWLHNSFNVGLVWNDFGAFLHMLMQELDYTDADACLTAVLDGITASQVQRPPRLMALSFFEWWQFYQDTTLVLQRAQLVFIDYACMIYAIVQQWPFARLTHAYSTGGPSQCKAWNQLKQLATGVLWVPQAYPHAELMGNAIATWGRIDNLIPK